MSELIKCANDKICVKSLLTGDLFTPREYKENCNASAGMWKW